MIIFYRKTPVLESLFNKVAGFSGKAKCSHFGTSVSWKLSQPIWRMGMIFRKSDDSACFHPNISVQALIFLFLEKFFSLRLLTHISSMFVFYTPCWNHQKTFGFLYNTFIASTHFWPKYSHFILSEITQKTKVF